MLVCVCTNIYLLLCKDYFNLKFPINKHKYDLIVNK